jgi:hypothetical protein
VSGSEGDGGDSGRRGGPERRIDALAMGQFIQALRRGATVEEAAAAAGFHVRNFYRKRDSDPEFAATWQEALELSDAPKLVKPGNGRRLQMRRTRRLKFTEAKKEIFLAHFAGTADLAASAEAAGVCVDTVRNHRNTDPEFDARCEMALEQSYRTLEEEAVRERLAAQKKLKEGLLPAGQAAEEFDRQLKLLAQWRRRDGSLGPRARTKASLQAWNFEDAVAALEKRLAALNIPLADGSDPSAPAGVAEASLLSGEGPLHHGQVDGPPDCPALSGGQGDLTISDGPPPRSGEE